MAKQRTITDPDDERYGQTVAEDNISLSEFVQTMHEPNYSPVGAEKGLPPLDWIKEQFSTKSAAVRFLVSQGFEVKDIAKHLGMKYQHVRNVATTTLKRGPNEDWRKPLLEGSNVPTVNDFKPVED